MKDLFSKFTVQNLNSKFQVDSISNPETRDLEMAILYCNAIESIAAIELTANLLSRMRIVLLLRLHFDL